MKGGHNRKPTAVKKAEGTYRKDRANSNEPELTVEIPPMPKWVPAKGKKYYKEICELLEEMKVVSSVDSIAIGMLVDEMLLFLDAKAEIKIRDLVIDTGTGGVKQNPAVSIRDRAWKNINSMLQQYGLTASSRARVNAKEDDEESDLEEFLKG